MDERLSQGNIPSRQQKESDSIVSRDLHFFKGNPGLPGKVGKKEKESSAKEEKENGKEEKGKDVPWEKS